MQVRKALELDGTATASAAGTPQLTPEEIQPLVTKALAQWREAGASPAALKSLEDLQIQVADLPDRDLGWAAFQTIILDVNGAGHGWSLTGPVAGQIDLLTVVSHELGHLLGMEHTEATGTMSETLAAGVSFAPAATISTVLPQTTTIPPLDMINHVQPTSISVPSDLLANLSRFTANRTDGNEALIELSDRAGFDTFGDDRRASSINSINSNIFETDAALDEADLFGLFFDDQAESDSFLQAISASAVLLKDVAEADQNDKPDSVGDQATKVSKAQGAAEVRTTVVRSRGQRTTEARGASAVERAANVKKQPARK